MGLIAFERLEFAVDLTAFCYSADKAVPVHDVMVKEHLGIVTSQIKANMPSHGTRLLRLGNKIYDGIDNVNNPTMAHFRYEKRQVKISQETLTCRYDMIMSPHRKHITVRKRVLWDLYFTVMR